jgi:hypothetical protein
LQILLNKTNKLQLTKYNNKRKEDHKETTNTVKNMILVSQHTNLRMNTDKMETGMVVIEKEAIKITEEEIENMINLNIKKSRNKKMIEEVIHLLKIVKTKQTSAENSTTNKLILYKMMDLLLSKKDQKQMNNNNTIRSNMVTRIENLFIIIDS